jgi:penicillin-binding protein 2
MASNPRYNPNNISRDLPGYLSDPAKPMYHRAAMGLYEPGSVIKIFESFALMEELGYSADHTESCMGQYIYGDMKIHCHKRAGHGSISLTNAVKLSCNIFFYKSVRELGATRLHYWMTKFGFNEKTGIDLPHEYSKPYPLPRRTADLIQLSIGQLDLNLNALQIQTALCAIANGGKLYKPRIAKKILPPEVLDPNAEAVIEFMPEEKLPPLDAAPKTFETIRQSMWEVVNNVGTGRRVKNSDFVLAGKTGTAQTSFPGKTHAWFVCYGPYEDPTIAITVLAEHSGHGGEVASPLIVPILEEYLSSPVIAQFNPGQEDDHVDD